MLAIILMLGAAFLFESAILSMAQQRPNGANIPQLLVMLKSMNKKDMADVK